jgi:PPP family 3-phenylpropionic acid transporter
VLSLALQPIELSKTHEVAPRDATALLRDPAFLAIILASAMIQGSHAAYYAFASITWQQSGLGGVTIAVLWALGVIAEIVVFAVSPRFTLQPAVLVLIGALSAVLRWWITALEPQPGVLAIVQLAHGLTFGMTQVGTVGLMLRHVPINLMAQAQGYLAACSGIVASSAAILSGAIFARYGHGVYYLMAAMGFSGAAVIWSARDRLALK